MEVASAGKVPVSFWIVGFVSLLWNGFGGYDYLMTRMRSDDYLANMGDPKPMLDWIDSFPVWVQVAWPVGVWFSVVGSLLLLARSRYAVLAFAISFAGAIISFAYQILSSPPPVLDTPGSKVIPAVILALIALQWWYARRKQADRTLR